MFSSNLFVMGLIAIGVIFIVCFFSYVRVPVNKIAFISGIGKNRVAKGKLVIYLRFFERVDYLDLSVFSVDVNTAVAVPTNDFINIKVDAVVNLQVDETAGILEIAAKNFLNRKSSDIAISVKDVLEGNLREIVGQMQLKEIVQNRKNFNEKVQENVAPDLREMGLKVISFNVQNFQEDKQVIENLGAENISKISKEASIARAEADKEIEIAKANANKEAMDIKLKTEQDIAEKENALAIKKAELKVKADTEKVKADVTYELEKERKRKEIEEVTGLSNLVREQKAIETNKAKYEAETIVPKQADAEARKVEKTKEAEAKKIEEQQAAEAKLYKEQREAEAIKLRALAEAEALDKKAEAMAKYGDAAKLEMYYNALPLVAKNLAEPLSKIGNITMYGEGNTTKFMSEMTQNLDKVLKAATDGLGIDAKALLTSYLGGKIAQNKNQSSKDEVIETEEK
ncbi:flotillin family protein [Fusobacterium polymorphum]|uniref:Flotillin n=1 Tax=Fusobacterium nucleatum subsp. polymorphum TaxID=76857 RepID=A0A2C5ZHH9_FUSNP|nr:flotillin family protein [Fusobacterium polymorphum]PHH98849.1 flotillin [Fusobacterium polymorphum]PIM76327.1 flotillin family protein [Fusobacterium polymorphum]